MSIDTSQDSWEFLPLSRWAVWAAQAFAAVQTTSSLAPKRRCPVDSMDNEEFFVEVTMDLPSGNLKMAIEIVDFPIKNGDFP